MKIHLGYVAIALNLPKVTSSSTVTYTNYNKINTVEKKLEKLKQVTLSNINDLEKILRYTIENDIHFYRITSQLVPLATHPDIVNWNYRKIFEKDFENLGKFINNHNLRVDTHPDEFNVLNSIKPEVVESTIRNLWFHANFFDDIKYPFGKMVLHIGSSQGGKEVALIRFIENFLNCPEEISRRLILENDDKTFMVDEVLKICKIVKAPMVLDVHHHLCNNDGLSLSSVLEDIFRTWEGQPLPPKIHFSSPRESERDRKHSDYISAEDFIEFVELSKTVNIDYDVMIEAKKKDLALFKLVEDIKMLKADWNWIDDSTLQV